MKFSRRSYEKELLDRNDIPFEDIMQNMKELDFINKYLGGHNITIAGVRSLLTKLKRRNGQISICEIGCGGGDNLRVIRQFCRKENIDGEFMGIDINPHCIEFARSRKENDSISFLASDYKLVQFNKKPDIIFSSLFTHHFDDSEVVEILRWMNRNSTVGFFVNDLHRHPVAYYSIKWITKVFSKSYLVKNDASLSVLRGFRKKELIDFKNQAAIRGIQLKWKWAFRWLLIHSNA